MSAPLIPIPPGRSLVACLILVCGLAGEVVAGTFTAASRNELNQVRSRVEAAHFLSMATFGPTSVEIDALGARIDAIGRDSALEEWIEEQFNIAPTYHYDIVEGMLAADGYDWLEPGINQRRYPHHAWWHAAIAAPDQLRQRMAWALSQIFVINEHGAGFTSVRLDGSGWPQYMGIVDYYDMLIENAFGNYRSLLEGVTLHPIMGVFLSHVKNTKGDPSKGQFPDENYAREVMQLFSIGLYQLQQDGVVKRDPAGSQIETYDNETIKAFARVFTGLSYADPQNRFYAPVNFHEPMVMHGAYHDTGEKVLLRGETLPAGQSGMADIAGALDNLFYDENVGPFIGRILIQRFVKSNPSKSYIKAVASAFGSRKAAVRGDFKEVIKAVLLHPEALGSQTYTTERRPYRLVVEGSGSEHSRLREPVLRYSALLRSLNSNAVVSFSPRDSGREAFQIIGEYRLPDMQRYLNQEVYKAHHVFNFYLPEFRPAGDFQNYKPSKKIPNGYMYAPEFEIFTPVAVAQLADTFDYDIRDARVDFTLRNSSTMGRFDLDIDFDLSLEEALAQNDPDSLLAHLDLLLCHGAMKDASRNLIAEAVMLSGDPATRARAAILAVLTSSDCAVSH